MAKVITLRFSEEEYKRYLIEITSTEADQWIAGNTRRRSATKPPVKISPITADFGTSRARHHHSDTPESRGLV